MYAVIRAGGKQYRVQENDTVVLERTDGAAGDSITIDEVLFIGGDSPRFGNPTVSGAKVSATIIRQTRGKKIDGFTYIKVKSHQTHFGHRQYETHIRIDKIEA